MQSSVLCCSPLLTIQAMPTSAQPSNSFSDSGLVHPDRLSQVQATAACWSLYLEGSNAVTQNDSVCYTIPPDSEPAECSSFSAIARAIASPTECLPLREAAFGYTYQTLFLKSGLLLQRHLVKNSLFACGAHWRTFCTYTEYHIYGPPVCFLQCASTDCLPVEQLRDAHPI